MKKKLIEILTKLKVKTRIIIKIIFSSDTIIEQILNKNTIILITSENENSNLLRFITDKDSIYKAINIYTSKYNKARANAHKNIITIKVRPKT